MSIAQMYDLDNAMSALNKFLIQLDYHRGARESILAHVYEHGELSGTVPQFLDAEHLESATEVLVESFRPVVYASPEWSEGEFAGTFAPIDRVVSIDSRGGDIFMSDLPPICGGSPEVLELEPYQPSERDLAEYYDMMDEMDARQYLARHAHNEIDYRQVTPDELAQIAALGCV